MDLLSKYKAMITTQEFSPPSLVVDKNPTTEEKKKERKNSKNVYKGNGDKIDKTLLWENPFPQGTPEARAESLRVIEAARRGEPIPYYETSELPSSSSVVENRPFTEKIVHIPKTNPTTDKKTQPPAKGRAEWPPEVQALVDWFLKLEPREIKPFHLEPHIHVADPVQFYESLRRDIKTGPEGARAKMATLQDDLRKLKAHLN